MALLLTLSSHLNQVPPISIILLWGWGGVVQVKNEVLKKEKTDKEIDIWDISPERPQSFVPQQSSKTQLVRISGGRLSSGRGSEEDWVDPTIYFDVNKTEHAFDLTEPKPGKITFDVRLKDEKKDNDDDPEPEEGEIEIASSQEANIIFKTEEGDEEEDEIEQLSLENEDDVDKYLPNPLFKEKIPKIERVESLASNEDQGVDAPAKKRFKTNKPQDFYPCNTEVMDDVLPNITPGYGKRYYNRNPPTKAANSEKVTYYRIRMLYGQDQEDEFEKIRVYFDSISEDKQFLELKFAVVQFNHYSSSVPGVFVPAEFCCVKFSLKNGIEWVGGSPIDPGENSITDWSEALEQCEHLSIPQPPYTYKAGLAYSVGEDRHEEILNSIFNQASTFLDHGGPSWRYVFTAQRNLPYTTGCLTWLMQKTGTDLRLRVLPIERLAAELFRTCQIRRYTGDLKASIIQQMELNINGKFGKPTDQQASFSNKSNTSPEISADDRTKLRMANFCLPNYIKSFLHGSSLMDTKIRFGCAWHQRETNVGSISQCSTTQCKKLAYLILTKSLDIMDIDYTKHAAEIHRKDIIPTLWTKEDAIGIEARQRFGFFGNISDTRIEILESRFIFHDLLRVLRKRMPDGMKRKPSKIIWPLNRNIEDDLNWSPVAPFQILDPEPGTRGLKRNIQLENRKQQEDLDWQEW